MKRIILICVLLALALPAGASAISLGRGKWAVESTLLYSQVGDDFNWKVSECYPAGSETVRCLWQTFEWIPDAGGWVQCYGSALASPYKEWVMVGLNEDWAGDCFVTEEPGFV